MNKKSTPAGSGPGKRSAAARGILATRRSLGVEWADGGSSEFDSLWLRDNRPADRDAVSGQRLIDVTDLPEDPAIRSAALADSTVIVEWEGEPEGTAFDLDWLWKHQSGHPDLRPDHEVRLWLEGSALDPARDFRWLPERTLRGDLPARAEWLSRLLQDGLAFVSEAPARESAVLEVARLIGRVAETNYGLTFDVRTVPQPENLAYSDAGLGLHTDNPYREPVPGFQALHVLVASPEGGDTLLADGFALAEQLRATAPEAFERLSTQPVPFRYESKDADLYAERPLIEVAGTGELRAVHYNSRSIAPLRLAAREVRPFYEAYRRFAAVLREPRFQVRLRLAEGTVMVFDNRRVLHGRTAYASARHARHLRGCYLTRDSVRSETAVLRRRLAAGRDP
jgi:alpha-ketoglutarate-dependent taurine dioxygenase